MERPAFLTEHGHHYGWAGRGYPRLQGKVRVRCDHTVHQVPKRYLRRRTGTHWLKPPICAGRCCDLPVRPAITTAMREEAVTVTHAPADAWDRIDRWLSD